MQIIARYGLDNWADPREYTEALPGRSFLPLLEGRGPSGETTQQWFLRYTTPVMDGRAARAFTPRERGITCPFEV